MTLLYLVQIALLLFVGFVFIVLVINVCTIRRLEDYGPPVICPRLSVLIPARDEAANIGRCVRSLLAQDYPNFEVLALDDCSTDATWSILQRLSSADARLKPLAGQPLPPGWMGKHWACHQLSREATGEWLLFTDADVWFHPQALSNAVAAAQAEQADLLAALPGEVVGSWAERLAVPLLNFAMLGLYPYPVAAHSRIPFMNIVNGQFMMFRRPAFEQIGGFEAVRTGVLDVQLGRKIKASGRRWRLVNGASRVFCRMYHTLPEVWSGFSKNLFPSFDYSLPIFLPGLLGLALPFLEPVLLRLLALAGLNIPPGLLRLADTSILLALAGWSIFYAWLRLPLYLALVYPATVMMALAIGLQSIYVAYTGQSRWKGRPYQRRSSSR